jgi:hypothetical protein
MAVFGSITLSSIGEMKMADDVHVTNPVSIESDSKTRVAFDLMQRIANHERDQPTSDRDYWLKLYTQCYKAVSGRSLENILKRDE